MKKWLHRAKAGITLIALAVIANLFVGNGNAIAEPIKEVCYRFTDKTGEERIPVFVKIVGNLSDLIEIWQGDALLHMQTPPYKLLYAAYTETRNAMGASAPTLFGPERGRLTCGRIGITEDFVWATLGWKSDLLHAYAVIRDQDRNIVALQQLQFNAHDGRLGATLSGHDLLVSLGRLGDRRVRFCFNDHTQTWWWSSGDSRHPSYYAACDAEAPKGWSEGGQTRIEITK
jgi:hypothetical protein